MSEQVGGPVQGGPVGVVSLDGLCPVDLLGFALCRLTAEDPVELAGPVALARTAELLIARERLQGAILSAVRDVDRRELFTLAAAGSTRGWLRTQLGGDSGQLMLARRLADRPQVAEALAGGSVSGRAAGQLCTVLEQVPDQVPEPAIVAVLTDGISTLLSPHTGLLALDSVPITPAAAAVRADLRAVTAQCLTATGLPPADRLEPALLLLAQHLPPGGLGGALELLLDALQPDRIDTPHEADYYLQLTPMLDGDWNLRGHLDPETGTLLAREIERRDKPGAATPTAATQEDAVLNALAETANHPGASGGEPADRSDTDPDTDPGGDTDTDPGSDSDSGPDSDIDPDSSSVTGENIGRDTADEQTPADPDAGAGADEDADHWDDELGPSGFGHIPRTPDPHASTAPPTLPAGQRRHDALRQLLHDLTDPGNDTQPGNGRPPPVALTIHATLDALEGRLGALPGTMDTPRGPTSLTARTLQRLGCHSELTTVLLDAHHQPVGASGTHRSATTKERRALRARWGPQCAITGCISTQTVPHHVRPWWLTHQTALRDLIPLCTHDHHELHEHHRTLRLKDGRHIDQLGWADPATDPPRSR